MYAKKITFLFIFWLFSLTVYSQTFNYSYTDPCTGAVKNIQVPSNGVTVTYYGQINTFQPSDFYNGNFESWSQGVYGSFGNNNPCASIVGLPAAITVAQNSAINFLGTINSLSALSDMANVAGSSNMLGGAVQSTQNSSSGGGKKDKSNKSNTQTNGGTSSGSSGSNSQGSNTNGNANGSSNGTSQPNTSGSTQTSTGTNSSTTGTSSGSTTNGSSTGTSSGSTTAGSSSGSTTAGSSTTGTSSGSTTTGSSTSGSSGGENGSSGSSTSTQENSTPTEEGGKTNLVGSSVSSVQNSTNSGGSSTNNKNGNNKPTILASSDFVGFDFQDSDVKRGGKFTGGYASMRWDGARSWGISADYTTALKGPNITAYYAFMKPKRIDLISVTGTIGFEEKPTLYGTIALGQMWNIGKKGKLKAVYMLTGSWGQVYGSPFIGTAAIAGSMYDFKITKRFDVKALMLYVYAPYVSYYNDILLKSPHVVLPIIGTNVNITKRFKLNVNVGGAWAVREAALNYTVMFGTRMLL